MFLFEDKLYKYLCIPDNGLTSASSIVTKPFKLVFHIYLNLDDTFFASGHIRSLSICSDRQW